MQEIKSHTDLVQSKKLAEFLPLESADMHYSKDFDGTWFIDLAKYTSVKIPKYVDKVEEHLLPCWSLAELINLLPSEITVVEEYLTTQYDIRIRKYKVTDEMDVCQIAYGNYGSSGSWHDMINTGEKESLLDAAFEMICWLKKEKYI